MLPPYSTGEWDAWETAEPLPATFPLPVILYLFKSGKNFFETDISNINFENDKEF